MLTAPARCARRERIRLSQTLSRFTYALSWFCVTGFTELSMLGLKRKVKSRCKVPPAAFLPCCHFPKSKLPKSPKSQIPNPKRLDFPILQSSHAAFLPFSDFPNPISRIPRIPQIPFQAQKGGYRLLSCCRRGSRAVSGSILRLTSGWFHTEHPATFFRLHVGSPHSFSL